MRRGISRGRLLGDAMAGDATLFGVVKAAQARGNFQLLAGRGRRALRVHWGKDVLAGLATPASSRAAGITVKESSCGHF
jgi:hypothetical protein